jgi:uncharacterized protein involved in exopolysaccharide biosynthesis
VLNRIVDPVAGTGVAGTHAESELLSLADIATFLRRYFRLIVVSTILAVAIAAALALAATPIYTARAQVLIDPRITQIQREQLGELSLPLDTAQMESQLTLLRSEGIAKAVIASLNLTEDPDFQAKTSSWWPAALRLQRAPPTAPTDSNELREAILRFQANLDVSRVGISYGIDIAFASTDPEKAARIANKIAMVYVQDQIETRRLAAQAGSLWLEDKITLLRRKMNAAARTTQEFKASRDYRLLPNRSPEAGVGAKPEIPKDAGITLEELESTAQTYRKLYESYLQAYTEALQRDSYPVSNARVISQALPPTGKSHPKTQLILALAALIGALLGVATAVIHNGLGGRIRARDI